MANSAKIPPSCQVLVVGGGPGGSYAASALAQEGLQVVLLEADKFPRYHIGESMLPAMRHLLRLIDADYIFDTYGFTKKIGGPDNYSWNVVRSDADMILFQHAARCGASIFDGVRVTAIHFQDGGDPLSSRPISASYVRKLDGSTGQISFEYIVDASGRAGLMDTKYLKNRSYNNDLRNIASWGYWKDVNLSARGTDRENTPFFEALIDGSGWAWFIPLHTATSIGIVINQDNALRKKSLMTPTPTADVFYLDQLRLAPTISSLIGGGKQILGTSGQPEIRHASDYSYMSSLYALPGLRIVGDAGAFIDPLFSSGVHLALMGALSAALTICAAIRGDCSEHEASRWHSDKVKGSTSWFLMVVLGTYKQIREQEEPILSEVDEDNFDRAFELFRPVIQGSVDVYSLFLQNELEDALKFCSTSWETAHPEVRDSLLKKIGSHLPNGDPTDRLPTDNKVETNSLLENGSGMSGEEQRLLAYLKSRRLLRTEDTMNIENFFADIVRGRRPRLHRGRLGLTLVENL